MSNRELSLASIYKYFKNGDLYVTLSFESKVVKEEQLINLLAINPDTEWMHVEHTETEEVFPIFKIGDCWCHPEIYNEDNLVLYKTLNNDDFGRQTSIYARDKSQFLSLVDKEKYPNTTQEYIFELVSK